MRIGLMQENRSFYDKYCETYLNNNEDEDDT